VPGAALAGKISDFITTGTAPEFGNSIHFENRLARKFFSDFETRSGVAFRISLV
jgi:hypothetical protein